MISCLCCCLAGWPSSCRAPTLAGCQADQPALYCTTQSTWALHCNIHLQAFLPTMLANRDLQVSCRPLFCRLLLQMFGKAKQRGADEIGLNAPPNPQQGCQIPDADFFQQELAAMQLLS